MAAGLVGCGGQRRAAMPDANLLLITLDTVRADRLGAYGYTLAETPRLDALARGGILFEQAMTAAPLTLPAHATLLSGLLPTRHGLRNNGAGRFPAQADTLASRLGGAGYRTGAFVGAFVLDHRFGLDRGFELYDDEVPRDPGETGSAEPERPAAVVVDRAVAWLKQPGANSAGAAGSRPYFAWVHLFDAHAPYQPPEPFRTRHPGRPYDGEIAGLDVQIGRLIDAAAVPAPGMPGRRTLIAVAADHGEALGEHGELTHGLLLYQSTLRVPLVLHAPGALPSGTRVAEPISLADLAPTLAGLLGQGLGTSGMPTDGRDLSAYLRSSSALPLDELYAETEYPGVFGWSGMAALRRGNWKLIIAPRSELFDLHADPGEEHSALARERRLQTELAGRLAALREQAAPEAAADAESRAQLRALGYATAAGPTQPSAGGRLDPKDAAPLFRAFEEALGLLRSGRAAEAVRELRALVDKDSVNPVFLNALAGALRQTDDLDAAITQYRRAAEAAPRDSQAWYELATAQHAAGELAGAGATLDLVLRLQPKHAGAHNLRGVLASARGEAKAALAAFERAAVLDPRDATVQNNLGNALRETGSLAESRAAYQRAIALAPLYADPLNGLAVVEILSRRPAAALPLLDRALALAPDRHEIHLNRGIAEQTLGNRRGAAAAYRRFLDAIGSDPRFDSQRENAGRLLAQVRDD